MLSTLVPWDARRDANPDTRVLLPPPLSKTLFGVGRDRYDYDRFTDTASVIGADPDGSGRTLVIGVTADGAAAAYPFEVVAAAGDVNDVVGETPVVIAVGPGGTLVAYDRRVDDTTRRFRRVDRRTLMAGGSRWLVDRGLAVDGPHEEAQLRRANDVPPLFKFAWVDFHPETRMYGEES